MNLPRRRRLTPDRQQQADCVNMSVPPSLQVLRDHIFHKERGRFRERCNSGHKRAATWRPSPPTNARTVTRFGSKR